MLYHARKSRRKKRAFFFARLLEIFRAREHARLEAAALRDQWCPDCLPRIVRCRHCQDYLANLAERRP
jgi:hypothetical protein